MTLIVDAHSDLAWNMFMYGRDYNRSALETRRLEAGTDTPNRNGDTLIGWPEYQRGQVAIVFSTLFAGPARYKSSDSDAQAYGTFDEAHKLYREQLMTYHRLTDSQPDHFRLIKSRSDLAQVLARWNESAPGERGRPVGLVVLMEGAEGIRNPAELDEWHELGLRLIGLAWVGTRYSGGWREPGPLTDDGRQLLKHMQDFNFILDLSHMDEAAALEALDFYRGPIVGTHGNCAALLPNSNSNRHFTDRVIQGIIDRDGVVGVVPFNAYLKVGWNKETSRRDEVPLDVLVSHIDHICQLAGYALHAGIGSDFDGGFGVQHVAPEIDTVADLQKLVPLLQARGYSASDADNILGGNWVARLKRELPT